ncbi:Putative F-box and FNIP repeat-containing protein L60 [Durusdinium trenchii]|uniref:F-box and FNIP repeat-containing protein L60 n=1 Tax=Durusdinium trenchii TaxID=1381693 RepID=A0ABP0S518_9DINO
MATDQLEVVGQTLDIQISGLDGHNVVLNVSDEIYGHEFLRILRGRVPRRPGGILSVLVEDKQLSMIATLKEQGIQSSSALFYVFMPGNALRAWKILRGLAGEEDHDHQSLHGMTTLCFGRNAEVNRFQLPSSLEGLTFGDFFQQSLRGLRMPLGLQDLTLGDRFDERLDFHLPQTLKTLTLGQRFNQSLENVVFPESLLQVTLGRAFNQPLEAVKLPCALQTLVLGHDFNQALQHVLLPEGLQYLSFGDRFNQTLDGVRFPGQLRSLKFGACFDQSLEGVTWPEGLEVLELGVNFNQSMDSVSLPGNLQALIFGYCFKHSLERVHLPSSLGKLTLGNFADRLESIHLPRDLVVLTTGHEFNQNLDSATLPPNLLDLTFGARFNQSLRRLELPSTLESLSFGRYYNRSLDDVILPENLRNLTFHDNFNQSLERVHLPAHLESLTFGASFNQPLERVQLPSQLKVLRFGAAFDRALQHVLLPPKLKHLIFGSCFNGFLQGVAWPRNLQVLTFGSRFNQSLHDVELPEHLSTLTLGEEFQQCLTVKLPSQLQALHLGAKWNQGLLSLPPVLKHLSFGSHFNCSLQFLAFPQSLESLVFGANFDQSLENVQLQNLRSLTCESLFGLKPFSASNELFKLSDLVFGACEPDGSTVRMLWLMRKRLEALMQLPSPYNIGKTSKRRPVKLVVRPMCEWLFHHEVFQSSDGQLFEHRVTWSSPVVGSSEERCPTEVQVCSRLRKTKFIAVPLDAGSTGSNVDVVYFQMPQVKEHTLVAPWRISLVLKEFALPDYLMDQSVSARSILSAASSYKQPPSKGPRMLYMRMATSVLSAVVLLGLSNVAEAVTCGDLKTFYKGQQCCGSSSKELTATVPGCPYNFNPPACSMAEPQTPRDLSTGAQGQMTPKAATLTDAQANFLPLVNVHFHYGAEHKSDSYQNGTDSEAYDASSGRRLASNPRPGWMCATDTLSSSQMTPYTFQYCKGDVQVGKSYEVHYVHSSAGVDSDMTDGINVPVLRMLGVRDAVELPQESGHETGNSRFLYHGKVDERPLEGPEATLGPQFKSWRDDMGCCVGSEAAVVFLLQSEGRLKTSVCLVICLHLLKRQREQTWQGANIEALIPCLAIGWIIRFLCPIPAGVSDQACSMIVAVVLRPLPPAAATVVAMSVVVFTGTATLAQGLKAFTDEVVWLVVIAFFLADGFQKTGLGDRIALNVIRAVGGTTWEASGTHLTELVT